MLTPDKATITLRSDTRTVTIDAPPDAVFAFVADPTNLPAWAVGFCRTIRRGTGDDQWVVTTAHGDVPIRYVTDERTGTIDFYFSVVPGSDVTAFSRVVPNGHGTDYIFTQFQSIGMSGEVFDAQTRALTEELQVLRGLMQARAVCRA